MDDLTQVIMQIREDLAEIKAKVSSDYNRLESHEAVLKAHESRITVIETTRKAGWMAICVVCSVLFSVATLAVSVLSFLSRP